jgi:hypothetical protein
MGGEFCPRCGESRTGGFRFCRKCGFDYEAPPEVQPPDSRPAVAPRPPVPSAPSPPPPSSYTAKYAGTEFAGSVVAGPPVAKGSPRGRWPLFTAGGAVLLVAVSVAVAGQAGKTGAGTSPPPSPEASTPGGATITPVTDVTSPPDVTPEPSTGLMPASLGQAVNIVCDGQPCMVVTVDQVKFASTYKDPAGYLNDTPETKGDVFMAVHVTYKATGPNADYNEWDWGAYVNDVAVSGFAFASNGPKPGLSAGDLPVGKTAAGWVVYEVPAKGHVTFIYQPGRNSVFEVTLRAS